MRLATCSFQTPPGKRPAVVTAGSRETPPTSPSGRGDLALTPLQMVCLVASLARGETITRPTLLHQNPPEQQIQPRDGIAPIARAAILAGMEAVTNTGTGRILQTPRFRVPGLRIAGKTGTAQKATTQGILNFAWFVGFVPVEKPQIAVAVIVTVTVGEGELDPVAE